MKQNLKKALALLLCAVMMLGLCSMGAGAVDDDVVATIDGTPYTSLAAVFSLGKDAEGKTIVLQKDIDKETLLGTGAIIIDLTNKTLDLNGHTISAVNNTLTFVGDNGKITNGNFVCKNSGSYALFIGKDYATDQTSSSTQNFVVEKVTTTGGVNTLNANVTLKNVNATGTDYYAVYLNRNSTVAIDGGTYSTASTTAASLFGVDQDSTLTLKDGTFTVNSEDSLNLEGEHRGTFTVNGGTFNNMDWVPYAADGATIKLANNCSGDGLMVTGGKNLTLDLNGHAYTVNGNLVGSTGTENQAFHFEKGSNVTIKNGTLAVNKSAKMLIQNYANLTLDNVKLDGSNVTEYVLSNNCGKTQVGKVDLTGTTSIINAGAITAIDVSWWPSSYPEGAQVTIDTTGTIEGDISLGVYGPLTADQEAASKSHLTINDVNLVGKIKPEYYTTGTYAVEEAVGAALTKSMCTVNGGTFSDMSWVPFAADGASVKLGADVKTPETPTYYIFDKSLTLDLNGHELSGLTNGGYGGSTDFIRVTNGATLTIKDSSPAKTGVISATYGANSQLSVIKVYENSTLILNSGTITNGAANYGAADVNISKNASFIMNGGTVAGAEAASNKRTYSVNVGSYGTTFTMNGGKITAPNSDSYAVQTSVGTEAAPVLVSIKDGAIEAVGTAIGGSMSSYTTLDISGGTITAPTALKSPQNSKLLISGGIFNGAVLPSSKSSISGGTFKDAGGMGYVAENGIYTMTGTGAISSDITIPTGATVTIASGAALTVNSGKTVTIAESAKFVNNGSITNAGNIVNNGEFKNNGSLTGNPAGGTGEAVGAEEVKQTITAAATEATTPEQVKTVVEDVKELPNEALTDETTLTNLKALEEKYKKAANVTVTPPTVAADTNKNVAAVEVDNAALSAPVGATVAVTVSAPEPTVAAAAETKAKDAVKEAFKAEAEDVADVEVIPIDITLTVDNVETEPLAPLVFKLKVNKTAAEAAKLVIVHIKDDNEVEVIRPTVEAIGTETEWVNLVFPITSLSTFVMVETPDTVNDNAYELIFTPDKTNASAGQEVTYTLKLKQTAGSSPLSYVDLGIIFDSNYNTPVFTQNTALTGITFAGSTVAYDVPDGHAAGVYKLTANSNDWTVPAGGVDIGTLKFTVGNAGTSFDVMDAFQTDAVSGISNADKTKPASLKLTTASNVSYHYVTVTFAGATPSTYYVPYGTNTLYTSMENLLAGTGAVGAPAVVATSSSYRLTDAANWYLADMVTTYSAATTYTSSAAFKAKQASLRTVTINDANGKFQAVSGFDGAVGSYKVANDQDAVFQLGAAPTGFAPTVTYKIGSGDAVPMTAAGGKYTIPMASITGNVTITITYAVNVSESDIGTFVDGAVFKSFSAYTGSKTLVLLDATDIGLDLSTSGLGMTTGEKIYKTNGYTGYTHCLLVDKTGFATESALKQYVISKLSVIEDINTELVYDFNTNGSKDALVADIQAAYDFFSRTTISWLPDEALVLIADINAYAGGDGNSKNNPALYTGAKDGVLTTADVDAFLYYYAQFPVIVD